LAPPNKTVAPPPLPQIGKPSQRADARRNREAIIDAARDRFCECGLECQMEDVARTAKVGIGTVYRHFPNKEALLEALIDERFERIAEKATEALEQDDAWDAFCELMRWSAEYSAQDRALSELLSQRPAKGRESAGKSGLAATTEKLIHKAQSQGKMRKDVVVEDVPTILCGLGGVIGAHEESMPALNWERFLALLLDGMRAPDNPGTQKLPKPKRPLAP
jgi:AcrR family transcriptional regulator